MFRWFHWVDKVIIQPFHYLTNYCKYPSFSEGIQKICPKQENQQENETNRTKRNAWSEGMIKARINLEAILSGPCAGKARQQGGRCAPAIRLEASSRVLHRCHCRDISRCDCCGADSAHRRGHHDNYCYRRHTEGMYWRYKFPGAAEA